MRQSTLFLIVAIMSSCEVNSPIDQTFSTLNEREVRLDSVLANHETAVLFFISPECPLCQNYSVTIDQIQADFGNENIAFYGVVSGNYYSESTIKGFLIKYDLSLPLILDPELSFANYYKAEITPEALLIGKNGEALYQGAIDNWAISLGQKRQTITERYLRSALSAHLNGEEINPKKTKAVGCFIE